MKRDKADDGRISRQRCVREESRKWPPRFRRRPTYMKKKTLPQNSPTTQLLLTSRLKTAVAHYPKSRNVFRQGDASESVMFIESGTVKITIVNTQGKEAVITLLAAGDFVGESCISNGSPA